MSNLESFPTTACILLQSILFHYDGLLHFMDLLQEPRGVLYAMSSIENFSSKVERTYIGHHKKCFHTIWVMVVLAGFAIFGPKMAIFGKFCILRTPHPRNLCDPSKEPQYANYMGCSKTCTPLK